MQGVVTFFGRIAVLIDQNTQAFHLFMTALLQVYIDDFFTVFFLNVMLTSINQNHNTGNLISSLEIRIHFYQHFTGLYFL